jgi:hypothetical protein
MFSTPPGITCMGQPWPQVAHAGILRRGQAAQRVLFVGYPTRGQSEQSSSLMALPWSSALLPVSARCGGFGFARLTPPGESAFATKGYGVWVLAH